MFERYHDLAAQERAAAQPPADGGRAVEAEMEAPGADPMAELTDALRKKSEQAAAEQSDEATSFASSSSPLKKRPSSASVRKMSITLWRSGWM